MTTDTTQISEDVGYALIETHLGLKKRHDHTVIDSKTGRYTDSARYFGLMDAAYQAGHAAAAAGTATPVAARWYVLTNDGMATLCADEADAKELAADADVSYPRMAPHRAVRLVPASQVAAAVAKEREPQMPEGWAFYSADFSSNAADAFKQGSVLLTRTGRNRAAWLAMSEEDQEVNALYASGRGFTLDEAVRAASALDGRLRSSVENLAKRK